MSLQLPRFHKKNSLDAERENFEKTQATCLAKAINAHEVAVKEKHVRSAIIGTYQERGASTFWNCALRLPLKENPVTCWKFCHVLHKILREGHDAVMKDSQKFKNMLQEHGKFWSHLKISGYGELIKSYCSLLIIKLAFHQRNSRIPGNLEIDEQVLFQTAGDEDALFQLSVEMFDYLDAILDLQFEIFKTLDSTRCNSMTNPGQCRLKPLIACIQDSILLYDYVTKILFRLHAKLSPDLLNGHRDRFRKVFTGLQNFYDKTMSLQYFKNLIDIQNLPKNPPNFLIQADLANYQPSRITVFNSEKDVSDTQSDIVSESLVSFEDTNTNGSSSPDPNMMAMVHDKDRQIMELQNEIARLKMEIERIKNQARVQFQQFQYDIEELRAELNEKIKMLNDKDKKIEELLRHECSVPAAFEDRMEKSETLAKAMEAKYTKILGAYNNLRTEHLDLLRKNATAEKELVETKKTVDLQSNLGQRVEELQREKVETETLLQSLVEEKQQKNQELEEELTELKSQIESVQSTKEQVQQELTQAIKVQETEVERLQASAFNLESSNSNLKSELDMLRSEISSLNSNLSNSKLDNEKKLSELDMLRSEISSLNSILSNSKLDNEKKLSELDMLQSEISSLNSILSNSKLDSEKKLSELDMLRSEISSLNSILSNSKLDSEKKLSEIEALNQQMMNLRKSNEAERLTNLNAHLDYHLGTIENRIRVQLDELEHPRMTGDIGLLDYYVSHCEEYGNTIRALNHATASGFDSQNSLEKVVFEVPIFGHVTESLILHGGPLSRTCKDIQKGDQLIEDIRSVGLSSLNVLSSIRKRNSGQKMNEFYEELQAKWQKLLEKVKAMGSWITADVDAAELLDSELHAMEQAIEEAAKKMQDILQASRASHTGVKLEVNEKLIDSCSSLMNAIRLLVQRSKGLQNEIVAQGRGTSSAKEFYKRNHQWTDGLISAAKAVGIGAKLLLESADKAVQSQGSGFEYLVASSQEITASTIQLVVASQVRADRSSNYLALLKQASTGVKTATANVVATSKDCAQLIEESDEIDVDKMTPHNAKRLELEEQAEVLRLESQLEKTRRRLAALRQHHYHSAD